MTGNDRPPGGSVPTRRVSIYEFDRRARELASRLDSARGDKDCWHAEFGFALTALGARLYGATLHVMQVTRWDLTTRPTELLGHLVSNQVMAEHHAVGALFNMDSAFEVLVYATNAFGYSIDPAGFRNFVTHAHLVKPKDVYGSKALSGYAAHFPRYTDHCRSHEATILRLAFELHDYSKHRSGVGGNMTLASNEADFPPEFDQLKGKPAVWCSLVPPTEVRLPRFPKRYYADTIPREDSIPLVEVHDEFASFFEELLARWLEDAHEAVRKITIGA